MQKITPHLWFDTQAVEAAEFYSNVFPDSKINFKTQIKDTPSGDCDIVGFSVMDFEFQAISAGPLFKFNPSISFHLKFKTPEEVDGVWEKLLPGGTVMMELGEYPFSKRYGWIQDKFGVSWQIIHADGEFEQRVVPVLMFTQDNCGKAEAAMNDYASIFPDSKATVSMRYGEGEAPDQSGNVKYGQLLLEGEEFGVMESAHDHKFTFNEAISLIVNCKDQAEIDYFWEKLSAVPEAEQCGWVKDQFGVSWQIIPQNMGELVNSEKTTQAMLKMKKIVIEELRRAAE